MAEVKTDTRFFRAMELPPDEGWRDLDEVPVELRKLMELYRSALEDGDESYERPFETIDDFYEIYDTFSSDNICFVAGVMEDGEETITTIANVRKNRDGTVFGEGIATSKEARGRHMGRYALDKILKQVHDGGGDGVLVRAQPRTEELWASLGATRVDNGTYPLMRFSTRPDDKP